MKFDFSCKGLHGVSPFGNAPGPGHFSQHMLMTADIINTTRADGAGGGAHIWQSRAGAIYSLFSAFLCDSGAENQPSIL